MKQGMNISSKSSRASQAYNAGKGDGQTSLYEAKRVVEALNKIQAVPQTFTRRIQKCQRD